MESSILFLDIDGVLNNQLACEADRESWVGPNRCYSVDPKAVKILNEFVSETGCDIVVSSTWRIGRTLKALQSLMFEIGIGKPILGVTERFNWKGAVRGNEIKAYLDDHRHYDFKRYVIFDDDSDMLLWQEPHFFKVDGYCGLTPNVCYRAKRFLDSLK